jgi:hypothetical protein
MLEKGYQIMEPQITVDDLKKIEAGINEKYAKTE